MNWKEFLRPNNGKMIFMIIIFLSFFGFYRTGTIPPSKLNIYFSYVILPCILFFKFPKIIGFWIIPTSMILWYLISCIVFSIYRKFRGRGKNEL